jgi:hypothetical protein
MIHVSQANLIKIFFSFERNNPSKTIFQVQEQATNQVKLLTLRTGIGNLPRKTPGWNLSTRKSWKAIKRGCAKWSLAFILLPQLSITQGPSNPTSGRGIWCKKVRFFPLSLSKASFSPWWICNCYSRFSIKLERAGSLCLTDPVENVQGYLKELETTVWVLKLYIIILYDHSLWCHHTLHKWDYHPSKESSSS